MSKSNNRLISSIHQEEVLCPSLKFPSQPEGDCVPETQTVLEEGEYDEIQSCFVGYDFCSGFGF